MKRKARRFVRKSQLHSNPANLSSKTNNVGVLYRSSGLRSKKVNNVLEYVR
jgi:hypothetical protein